MKIRNWKTSSFAGLFAVAALVANSPELVASYPDIVALAKVLELIAVVGGFTVAGDAKPGINPQEQSKE